MENGTENWLVVTSMDETKVFPKWFPQMVYFPQKSKNCTA